MSTYNKAIIAVILGNVIFGFSFLFSKIALEIAVPSVLVAIRFTVAFIVLNIIVLAGRRIRNAEGQPLVKFSLKGKPIKYVLLLAIFQPVVYFIAESYGIAYTSSAFAGTIIAVLPIAGVVFDVLLMHAKVTVKQIVCAVASVIGVAITTLGAQNMESSALGVAFLILAVIAAALFYVFSRKASAYYSPLERTYVMFAIGCAVFITFAAVQCAGNYQEMFMPALTTGRFWVCILYLAVVSSVVAFMALNFGSSHVSVSQAALFANLTTVISIIAGVVVLGETFTLQQIIGAIIIIGSVYISSIDKSKVEG